MLLPRQQVTDTFVQLTLGWSGNTFLAGFVGSHLSRHRLAPRFGGMWPSPGRRTLMQMKLRLASLVSPPHAAQLV